MYNKQRRRILKDKNKNENCLACYRAIFLWLPRRWGKFSRKSLIWGVFGSSGSWRWEWCKKLKWNEFLAKCLSTPLLFSDRVCGGRRVWRYGQSQRRDLDFFAFGRAECERTKTPAAGLFYSFSRRSETPESRLDAFWGNFLADFHVMEYFSMTNINFPECLRNKFVILLIKAATGIRSGKSGLEGVNANENAFAQTNNKPTKEICTWDCPGVIKNN